MGKPPKSQNRQDQDDDEKPKCETSIKILEPPPPDKIKAGSKTIDVKVEYTAQLSNGDKLTDCRITVIVEKIDLGHEKVADTKYTAKDAASPVKNKQMTITADSDMKIAVGDGVRITATLICNECRAISDPVSLSVRP